MLWHVMSNSLKKRSNIKEEEKIYFLSDSDGCLFGLVDKNHILNKNCYQHFFYKLDSMKLQIAEMLNLLTWLNSCYLKSDVIYRKDWFFFSKCLKHKLELYSVENNLL